MNCPARCIALSISFAWTVLGISHADECVCLGGGGRIADSYSGDPLRPDFITGVAWGKESEAGFGNNVAACSGPFCPYTCRSEGIYFSADMVFFDIWHPDGEGIAPGLLSLNTPAADAIDGVDPEIDPAVRYELGYLTCEGLGAQIRYLEIDTAGSLTVPQSDPADPDTVLQAWDVSMFDVEVVRKLMLKPGLDTTLSGGYRFARYEESAALRLNTTELATLDTRFTGNGVTGAVGVRSQLARGFSVNANGRASLLFGGQTTSSSVALPPNSFDSGFDARYTIESQLAATYEHPLCGGGFWFVRGGYEMQYWNDFVVPVGTEANYSSPVFHGMVIAVGLQR